MINKLHGIKFPKNKKGYQKLGDSMSSFYEEILDDQFEESTLWPSVPETETAELKVGDVVSYLYLILNLAMQRINWTTRRSKWRTSS